MKLPHSHEAIAPDARRRRLALSLAGLAFAATSLYFLLYGRTNHDEGWYLYAARLVLEGQLPYRDFPFYQAPLLPLLHAPIQWAAPGIEAGRWLSLAMSGLMCAIAMRFAFERGGAVAVGIVTLGFVSSPQAILALTTTRTEPATTLFLMVATWMLTRAEPRLAQGSAAAVAGVLAAATRVSMVPAALFIALWAVRRCTGSLSEAIRLLVPSLIVGVATLVIVLAGGFERAWLNLFEIQSLRHEQFAAPATFGIADWAASRFAYVAQLGSAFGVLSLACCAVTLWVALAWCARSEHRQPSSPSAWMGPVSLLAFIAWFPNLFPRHIYPVYFVVAMPLVLVIGGCATELARERLFARVMDARLRWVFVGLAALVIAALQAGTFFANRPFFATPAPTDLALLRVAASRVAAVVPEGTSLLTFDTYLAVEAERRVPTGFEMSVFSWFPRRPSEDWQDFGLLTTERLNAAFETPDLGGLALSDQAVGILVDQSHFGFRPRRRLSEAELRRVLPVLERFRLVTVLPQFGQHRTPLYLFTRGAD